MTEDNDTNRRMDFRQDTMLRITEEVLTPEAFEIEEKKSGAELYQYQASLAPGMAENDPLLGELVEEVDSSVLQAIQALESKLNYLIGMTVLQEAGQDLPEERVVNISATGISFVSTASISVGNKLKISMILPLFPPVFVEILAEVVHIKKMTDGKNRVSTIFIFRGEYELQGITKYVFKLQRDKTRAHNMRINR